VCSLSGLAERKGARLFARLLYAAVQLPSFPLWLLLAYDAIVVLSQGTLAAIEAPAASASIMASQR
jgi:hypothetical protein